MATFTPNKPVVTQRPVVLVENELRPGIYEFHLVVENQRQQQSRPARHRVTVLNTGSGGIIVPPRDADST